MIMEMKINTTMGYHLSLEKMAIIKKISDGLRFSSVVEPLLSTLKALGLHPQHHKDKTNK
jgi:hypothetical protein